MTTDEAIKFFGSKSALARALGITHAAVVHWGEEPPLVRQFQIEVLTNGELRANRTPKKATRTPNDKK